MTVTAFGIGLGIGNLCAGRLRRVCGREEISLVGTTSLLAAAIATFVLFPLSLAGSFGCLIAWGAALGAGAPSGTTILAERARGDKGMVLAFAETLNNVFIFGLLPAASALFDQGNGCGSHGDFGGRTFRWSGSYNTRRVPKAIGGRRNRRWSAPDA